MLQVIETRELIELQGVEGIVRGTYHKTRADAPDPQPDLADGHGIGILFLNSMSPTRAANGDAAVYLADAFAECGYPSFRIDLPAFGDSDNDPAPDLHGFVNLGGYGAITSAKIEQLVTRFKLSGIIIVGQCAGAVSAIHAAAMSDRCKGLVLMGPYFHLPKVKTPAESYLAANQWYTKVLGELLDRTSTLREKVRGLLRESSLPDNANFSMLYFWRRVASKGLPILILRVPERKSSGVKGKAVEFDYLTYIQELAGRRSKVVVKVADGANQSFSNFTGRESVRRHTELWLNAFFTGKDHLERNTKTAPIDQSDGKHQVETREECLYQ